MPRPQQTIQSSITLEGIGIHSGKKVHIRLCPAKENTGIRFIRTDQNNSPIHVTPKNITHANRATFLSENNISIATPEHLLAACYGCEIDNLIIEIDNEEVPILDGSSLEFSKLLTQTPPVKQTEHIKPLLITTEIKIESNDSYIKVSPSDTTTFSYSLDYPNHFIGSQEFSSPLTPKAFINDIAPARTYGFLNEIQSLLDKNLAQGGSFENAIVIGESDYLTPLRFPNELARHKLLDMIGDISIFGRPIQGHFSGYKSGHNLNTQLVKKLFESYK